MGSLTRISCHFFRKEFHGPSVSSFSYLKTISKFERGKFGDFILGANSDSVHFGSMCGGFRRFRGCHVAAQDLSHEENVDGNSKKASRSISKQKGPKRRLDALCRDRFPHHPPGAINSWILQGKVLVDGQPILKPGTALSEISEIEIIAEIPRFVCRGGLKLEAALQHFKIDLSGAVVLDSGISTGGFTDCVLQYGAVRVYGIDVGYGQVSERIRTDCRVTIMERTNLRQLTSLPELVDVATLDLSFISLLTVLPAVCLVLKPHSRLLTLIKPQFEARREQVGEGGIVRDPNVHKEVLDRVILGIEKMGFKCDGWIPSPIKGAEGNIEFLASFQRTLAN